MVYRLTIEPTGDVVDVAEGQTLLDACLRAGLWLPHACGHGLCGTCKVAVVDGMVDHRDASPFALMDFERDEGKTLACVATLEADTVIEADLGEDIDALPIRVGDYVGTVTRTAMLTSDILGMWLALPGEGMNFQAGQYVALEIPGVAGTRSFSIASPPMQRNLIEFHIRLVQGGAGTPWLHANATEGLQMRLSGPYGRFFVRRSANLPKIFLAGGSGLSSPQSMIIDLLETGDASPITLIHGARTEADIYNAGIFHDLAAQHPSFRYVPAISAGAGGGMREGFVHEVAHEIFGGSFQGHQAYLCGPPAMIDACVTTLMRGRLFEQHIFMEKFLTPADAAQARSPLFRKV